MTYSNASAKCGVERSYSFDVSKAFSKYDEIFKKQTKGEKFPH